MGNMQIEQAKCALIDATGKPLTHIELIERAGKLSELLLLIAKGMQTRGEKRQEKLLAKLIRNPKAKAESATLLDSCFRSKDPKRTIDQVVYLLSQDAFSSLFTTTQRWLARSFKYLAPHFPKIASYLLRKSIKHYVRDVIAPGERKPLLRALKKWREKRVKINLNRLGEAILGEHEARVRFQEYMQDLADPNIEVISIKISSIASQLNLLAFDQTLNRLKARLRELYRQAARYKKFINLDMEEYRDLELTCQLFMQVLDEPEFQTLSAGIALQSYIPDSFQIQKEITEWAIKRKGAKVKIRIVKGANLGMEKVESSLKEWPQAPYKSKAEVDANFKKMVQYGMQKEHASNVSLGIGSHNLFDIAYSMLLAKSYEVESDVTIEMLAGMCPHITRAIQAVWPNVLLYLPCATSDAFHTSMAYLMRRLDENTSPDNFLTHLFDLKHESIAWTEQLELFASSSLETEKVSTKPRRIQDRKHNVPRESIFNEPDTDFSLATNREWAESIIEKWKTNYHEIHLVIRGHELVSSQMAQGIDPSRPDCKIHTYFLAQNYQVDIALETAMMQAKEWAANSLKYRLVLLKQVVHKLRHARASLIGAMVQEAGKIITEADAEISEAIDFVEYAIKEADAQGFGPKLFSTGKVALVLTPWNFPCSIPTNAIVTSLIAGYSVIFKPAPEAILSGWLLAQCFWQAGIPKDVLQFITCQDEPMGSKLVRDPRVDIVILTGGTQTARHFLNLRPNIKLFAETGGKNSLIVSRLSDRDLAVKDAIHSAFGYAGQKCSALSLLVLEEEVYFDKSFREQLLDAASTLQVGQSYDLNTIVSPLIRPPSPHLFRALTTLDAGETWLLKPRQDPNNPHLWSPGIKLGIKADSFMHQTELFGPVLAVMCAKNIPHAIQLANRTPYGLTAGLHSLDPREYQLWAKTIQAGNCYHNRQITGAIVARQPFGGCKASSFGMGMKVGGPNYLLQLATSTKLPAQGRHELNPKVKRLAACLKELGIYKSDLQKFLKAAESMAFWWEHYFSKPRILRRLIGQDNILEFRLKSPLFILIQENDLPIDSLLLLAGAATCNAQITVGASFIPYRRLFRQGPLNDIFEEFGWKALNENVLIQEIKNSTHAYLRVQDTPPDDILEQVKAHIGSLDIARPTSDGRIELLHFLREVSISSDYHRYGNLMEREGEFREPTR